MDFVLYYPRIGAATSCTYSEDQNNNYTLCNDGSPQPGNPAFAVTDDNPVTFGLAPNYACPTPSPILTINATVGQGGSGGKSDDLLPIIGGAVGGGVLLIGTVTFCYLRRKRRSVSSSKGAEAIELA